MKYTKKIIDLPAGEMAPAPPPTMWWLADDQEYSHDDPDEFLEPGEYATGTVLHMTCAAKCPDEFYTVVGDLEADEDQSLRPSTVAEVEAYLAGLRELRDRYQRVQVERALARMKAQAAQPSAPSALESQPEGATGSKGGLDDAV